jgi:uncharacterized protein (DUF2384 family)
MGHAAHVLDAIDEIIAWAHDELGLTYDEIGSVIGVTDRTLRRWRTHDQVPHRKQRDRVEDLRELRYLLQSVFPKPEHRQEWLHASNAGLRGRTPLSLVRAGRVERIVDELATFESGAFV